MTGAVKILDWIATIALLIMGVWFFVDQWPEPSWWAWTMLVLGIVGVPLTVLNPIQKLRTWLLRRMIKR